MVLAFIVTFDVDGGHRLGGTDRVGGQDGVRSGVGRLDLSQNFIF